MNCGMNIAGPRCRRPGLPAVALIALTACALLFGGACAPPDKSPRIFCEVSGTNRFTGFTLQSFRAAVQKEHGRVISQDETSVKSPGVEVYFIPLDDGTLLADKVAIVKTLEQMPPERLFGFSKEPAE